MSVDTPQAPPEEPDAAVHSLPHEVQLPLVLGEPTPLGHSQRATAADGCLAAA